MEFKKLIFVIAGLFLISVPATAGRIHLTPDESTKRTKSVHPFELNRQSIVVAENESNASESERQSTNENREQAPDSGTADREKNGKTSNDAGSKPLKPFKPSEEIAAEQAVDFPVDI
jgi:hypothetical protein